MPNYTGQSIIVTGGAGGIGSALCQDLASNGAQVGVFDLNREGADSVAAEISRNGGSALAYGVDITDYDAVADAVTQFESSTRPLYGLVNNAGWDIAKPFVDTDPDLWARILSVNLTGPLNVTHIAVKRMREYGEGRVVSIASDAGRVGSTGEAVYSAAKGGIITLMKSLAREFARSGVTFNTVCPGPTDTPLLASFDAESGGKLVAALERAIPMRRLAQPSDFPETVNLFLSPASGYITGQTISISGGLTMHG